MEWGLRNRLRRMHQEMDRLFNEMFEEPFSEFIPLPLAKKTQSSQSLAPSENLLKANTDLYETDKDLVAQFDLPGVEKKDIDIKITNSNLSVRVEKKSQKEEKDKNFHLLERTYSGFYRCIALPEYLKPEQAKAEYKNGVLTITIPKDEKKIKEKEIKIEVD